MLSRSWLERRLELFETFCLPAMRMQTAPHEWLIWFDAGTPSDLRKRIEAHDEFIPVWIEGTLDAPTVLATIEARLPKVATRLITTRLDNDDGIAHNFLARIQQAACGREDVFFNFPLGYQWQDGRLYFSIQRSNPFLSYVECLEGAGSSRLIRSVMSGNHELVARSGRLRQLWGGPMWLQVLHGDNVANEMWGVRRTRKTYPQGFPQVPLRSESWSMREADVLSSLAYLASLPWRRRAQIRGRLRDRATSRRAE